ASVGTRRGVEKPRSAICSPEDSRRQRETDGCSRFMFETPGEWRGGGVGRRNRARYTAKRHVRGECVQQGAGQTKSAGTGTDYREATGCESNKVLLMSWPSIGWDDHQRLRHESVEGEHREASHSIIMPRR